MKVFNTRLRGEHRLEKRTRTNTALSSYIGYNDGSFRRLNSRGNRFWTSGGFSDGITDIEENSNRETYVSSLDNTIRKFDVDGVQLWSSTDHTGSVNTLFIDNENDEIFSASSDNTVKRFDNLGNVIWTFSEHTNSVVGVALDVQRYAYSASLDGTVKKIDLDGQSSLWSMNEHAGNINGIFVDIDGFVYSYGADNRIIKYNGSTGEVIWNTAVHTSSVVGVSVDQYSVIYSVGTDGILRILGSDGQQTNSIDTGGVPIGITVDVSGYIYVGLQSIGLQRYDNGGTLLWTYKNHTSDVSAISASQQIVMFPPIITAYDYYELFPPENLTAE